MLRFFGSVNFPRIGSPSRWSRGCVIALLGAAASIVYLNRKKSSIFNSVVPLHSVIPTSTASRRLSPDNDPIFISSFNPNDTKSPFRFRNLVLSGGALKGLYTIGALAELDRLDPQTLAGVQRIAGTSVGAIIGTLLAVGYTPKELQQILLQVDMLGKLKEEVAFEAVNDVELPIYIRRSLPFNLPAERFTDWLDELIQKKISSLIHGDESDVHRNSYHNCTFAKLNSLIIEHPDKFKHLHLIISKFLNNGWQPVVFNSESSEFASYTICGAVRSSMSIPVVLKRSPLNILDFHSGEAMDDVVITSDGGVNDNYNFPIHLFDLNSFHVSDTATLTKPFGSEVFNWQTFGIGFSSESRFNSTSWPQINALLTWFKIIRPVIVDETSYRELRIPTTLTLLHLIPKSLDPMIVQKAFEDGAKAMNTFYQGSNRKVLTQKQQQQTSKFHQEWQHIIRSSPIIKNFPSPCLDYINSSWTMKLQSHCYDSPQLASGQTRGKLSVVTGFGGAGKTTMVQGYLANNWQQDLLIRMWEQDLQSFDSSKLKVLPKFIAWKLNRSESVNKELNPYLPDFERLYEAIREPRNSDPPVARNDPAFGSYVIDQLLSKGYQWVLFFDNVCCQSEVMQFIQSLDLSGACQSHGHFIFTSRDPNVISPFGINSLHQSTPIHMDRFNHADCRRLMWKIFDTRYELIPTGQKTTPQHHASFKIFTEQSDDLIELSSGVPLFIKVATARIFSKPVSIVEYKTNYLHSLSCLPDNELISLGLTGTQESIIRDSINCLDGTNGNKVALWLLRLISLIEPSHIPMELILKYQQQRFEMTSDEAINQLIAAGLIWKSEIHPFLNQLLEVHSITQLICNYMSTKHNTDAEVMHFIDSIETLVPDFNNRTPVDLARHHVYAAMHLRRLLQETRVHAMPMQMPRPGSVDSSLHPDEVLCEIPAGCTATFIDPTDKLDILQVVFQLKQDEPDSNIRRIIIRDAESESSVSQPSNWIKRFGDPQTLRLWNKIAKSMVAIGRMASGYIIFQQLIQLAPDNSEIQLLLLNNFVGTLAPGDMVDNAAIRLQHCISAVEQGSLILNSPELKMFLPGVVLSKDVVLGTSKNTLAGYFHRRWQTVDDFDQALKLYQDSLELRSTPSLDENGAQKMNSTKRNIVLLLLEYMVRPNSIKSQLLQQLIQSVSCACDNASDHKDAAFICNIAAMISISESRLLDAQSHIDASLEMYKNLNVAQSNINDEGTAAAEITAADILYLRFLHSGSQPLLTSCLNFLQRANCRYQNSQIGFHSSPRSVSLQSRIADTYMMQSKMNEAYDVLQNIKCYQESHPALIEMECSRMRLLLLTKTKKEDPLILETLKQWARH